MLSQTTKPLPPLKPNGTLLYIHMPYFKIHPLIGISLISMLQLLTVNNALAISILLNTHTHTRVSQECDITYKTVSQCFLKVSVLSSASWTEYW